MLYSQQDLIPHNCRTSAWYIFNWDISHPLPLGPSSPPGMSELSRFMGSLLPNNSRLKLIQFSSLFSSVCIYRAPVICQPLCQALVMWWWINQMWLQSHGAFNQVQAFISSLPLISFEVWWSYEPLWKPMRMKWSNLKFIYKTYVLFIRTDL